MSRTGRPLPPLTFTDEERCSLQARARRPTSAQRLASRAKIVLACAEGLGNDQVARRVATGRATVGKWPSRFLDARLDGLCEEPRPGAPRTITDDQVDQVVARTLDAKPKAATHWSTRSMAGELGLSQTAVARIWRSFGLRPQLTETFKLSTDPLLANKVRDVVGLYSIRPTGCWSSASTRRARSRRWTAPGRSCPRSRASPSGTPTTTPATARPRCSRP